MGVWPVMTLEERFRAELQALALSPGTGLVAVSGGADSLALLALLAEHRDAHPLRLVVAHADHGIHPASGEVAGRVGALAERLGLPLVTTRLALGPAATETRARRARWRWLFATLDRMGPGVILTAHHRDDQVETVLMRVLSGSGPAGLTGMAPASSRVVRPLLGFRREELRNFVVSRALDPWEDPANLDPRHLRGWLRSTILPALRARLGDLDQRIESVARQAAHDRAAWDAALEAFPLAPRVEHRGISIASGPLRVYNSRLSASLVMAAARRAGFPLGPVRASRVVEALRRSQSGVLIELGGGWNAELRFDRVALIQGAQPRVGQAAVVIEGPAGEVRLEEWRIRWRTGTAPAALGRNDWRTWLSPARYEIRAWQAGDRIRPLGGRGSRPVARCLQERRVGRSDRPGWPVVVSDGVVVWVPGVCRALENVPVEGMEAWRLDVDRP